MKNATPYFVRSAKVLTIGLLFSAATAIAATPIGYWEINAFQEPNLAHLPPQSNLVCYLADGSWYSITYPGANGFWFQKGDRIRSSAFSPKALGLNDFNHTLFGQFASNTLIAGEYIGFKNNPLTHKPDTIDKGNFIATFVRRDCPPPPKVHETEVHCQ